MRFGHPGRTHLDQPNPHAPARKLIRRLAAGKTGSNHGYLRFTYHEIFRRCPKSVNAAKREDVIVAFFAVPVNRRLRDSKIYFALNVDPEHRRSINSQNPKFGAQ